MEAALLVHFGNELCLFQVAGCLAELVLEACWSDEYLRENQNFSCWGASCK